MIDRLTARVGEVIPTLADFLSFAFFAPSLGLAVGSVKPALHLRHRDCVLRCWLANLDVEDGRGTDVIDPGVTLEHATPQDGRLEYGLRLHFGHMANAAGVNERDGADPQRHGQIVAYSLFIRLRSAVDSRHGPAHRSVEDSSRSDHRFRGC